MSERIRERAHALSIVEDDGFCVQDSNIEEACIKIAEEQRDHDIEVAGRFVCSMCPSINGCIIQKTCDKLRNLKNQMMTE